MIEHCFRPLAAGRPVLLGTVVLAVFLVPPAMGQETPVGASFPFDLPIQSAAPSAQFSPAIAGDGTNYLAVWQNNRSGLGLDIYGSFVSTNGEILNPSGFAITSVTNDQSHPTIAFNGTHFLVAWQDGRNGNQDIYATRITTTGRLVETNGIQLINLSSDQRLPAVASVNGEFLIVWQDGRNGPANQDVYGARIQANGTLVNTNGFVISAAANSQSAPAVGTQGSQYLVAWHDFRSGIGLDVYAARVSSAGSVLDANGVLVSAAANDQWNVQVSGNATTGVIVWQDGRNGTDDEVYGARISSAGALQDPNGFPVVQSAGQQRFPHLTVLGNEAHVTWQDNRGGNDFDLYTARVDLTGPAVTPAGGLLVSGDANDQRYPALAAVNNQLLVVWEDIRNGSNTDIYGARLTTGGTLLDPVNRVISTVANVQETPAVASNGSIHLAVWRDYRNDPLGDIYGARIDSSGTVLDDPAIPICTAGNYQLAPRVAASGDDFLVVWQDFRNGLHDDIYGARVLADGTLLDPTGIALSTSLGAQRLPAVAGGTNGWMVVWQDRRSGTSDDVYGTRVGLNGAQLDSNGLAIGVWTADQLAPAVAALGDSYFVVWEDWRNNSTNRIFGNRITGSSGELASGNGTELPSATGGQSSPRIAAAGGQYLTVWQQSTAGGTLDIRGTRLTPGGVVVDTNSLAVSTAAGNQRLPVIAPKGSDFMVAWEDHRTVGKTNVHATRVTSNGAVLEAAGQLVSDSGRNVSAPALSYAGGRYLLAYQTRDAGGIRRAMGNWINPSAIPVITLSPGSSQFIAGAPAIIIDPAAVLVDGENAGYESATLTVSILTNGTANDRLGIRHEGNGPGQLGINGNSVTHGGALIGFFTGGTSGSLPLLVILNSTATADSVLKLVRSITFNNVSATPFTQPRTIQFQLSLPSGSGSPATRTVSLIDAGTIPSIVTQPVSQTFSSGTTATLSVVASGSQPFTFQWRLNGTIIVGATNATFTINSANGSHAGAYTVTVSNTYGSVTSGVASMTLFDLAMYAGLSIAGEPGSTHRIEFLPAFGGTTNWTTLTNLTLSSGTQLYIDPESPGASQRFYRAVPVEPTP